MSTFYILSAIGFLSVGVYRYLISTGWDVVAFVKQDFRLMLKNGLMTALLTYFAHDLVALLPTDIMGVSLNASDTLERAPKLAGFAIGADKPKPNPDAPKSREDWPTEKVLVIGRRGTEADRKAFVEAMSQPGALTGGLNYYRATPMVPPKGDIPGARAMHCAIGGSSAGTTFGPPDPTTSEVRNGCTRYVSQSRSARVSASVYATMAPVASARPTFLAALSPPFGMSTTRTRACCRAMALVSSRDPSLTRMTS